MYYCVSIFSVTSQNHGHIIENKGESEIITDKGKVMKNKMMGQGDKRKRRR
jgi:hypothetical protein